MTTLKDALIKINERHERAKEAELRNVEVLEEWQGAVAALIAELRKYLEEYETACTLSFSDDSIRLSEDGLGSYVIGTLKMTAGPTTIMVEPVGRFVGETQGRVDMFRGGQGHERVMFIRRSNIDHDLTSRWRIRLPRSRKRMLFRLVSRNRSIAFNKRNLELAVELLLN